MRKIVYLFIFAILLLVLKAFVLDEYIAHYFNKDANTTSAQTETTEVVQPAVEPEKPLQDTNESKEKRDKNTTTQKQQEMPLEKLGDEFSKHIKL